MCRKNNSSLSPEWTTFWSMVPATMSSDHSPALCGSLLHLRSRSMGKAASENTSGCWDRSELNPCDCAGSQPRPVTLILTRERHRSRSQCRAQKRLPPLSKTFYFVDDTLIYVYNQMRCRTYCTSWHQSFCWGQHRCRRLSCWRSGSSSTSCPAGTNYDSSCNNFLYTSFKIALLFCAFLPWSMCTCNHLGSAQGGCRHPCCLGFW